MLAKQLIVFIGLFSISNALTLLDVYNWMTYKMQHGKSYSNFFEDSRRMNIYLANQARIAEHNALYQKGLVTYTQGLNEYSDLSHDEFVTRMNGFRQSLKSLSDRNATLFSLQVDPSNIPNSIDWRERGAVTAIKNQGQCGSCWSFSTTGCVEGQHYLKTGNLVSLSEQNLIDCSRSYGNQGCNGGLMDQGFEYIRLNGGIDTESAYPYQASDGVCSYNSRNSGATVNGYVDIPEGNEDDLKAAIATVGPVSVAIDASQPSFQHYQSGIYNDNNCNSQQLDHGVLAVGYGTDSAGNDYYIVKNSWGTSWGENGFVRMARNQNNRCGIATMASYPLV